MRIRFMNILFILLVNTCNGGWRDVLKDIKQKAQENMKNRQKTKNFLGYDLSEYPGTNDRYRAMNNKQWTQYYECLSAQEKNLGHHQSINPIAIAVFEGASVKLDCTICLSPENVNDLNEVEWYFAPNKETSFKPVELDEHTLISPGDKALLIYDSKLERTGQYMCSIGQTITAPYFVTTVRSFESNINEVHRKSSKYGPYPKDDLVLPQQNIRLTTAWGPWSPCSQCGKVGKHYRSGFCIVKYQNEEKMNGNEEPASKKHLEIIKLFSSGIPCDSHIIPDIIKNLPEVKGRKNERMIGLCQEKCKTEAVYEVKDEYGHVLERANNSEGIYSIKQGIPSIEPHIEKTLEYKKAHSDITLTCPGNLNSDTPIEWQMGQRILIPELISKESNGRIYIGLTDKLHIRRALVSDTNIYSCWQHKELAGIVRLIVEKKMEFHFNHHIMMLAMLVILFTFFSVFTKAYFGRKYAKIKD